jgi:hypothetical protein
VKLERWQIVALISCAVWLAYYPALFAPLNSVDDVRLAHDLLNRNSFFWEDFWYPRSKSYFRPVVNSSFIVDQLVWGFEAPLLHFENVFLHWLNTLLVYALCRQVASRMAIRSSVLPALAALLFGLHPINSEAVIWIAGRADLLATTFVLLALLFAMKVFNGNPFPWAAATALAMLVGALAKETALLLLPGLVVMGWLSSRDGHVSSGQRALTWNHSPAVACSLAIGVYAALRNSALKGSDLGTRHVASVVSGVLAPVGAVSRNITQDDSTGLTPHLETILRGAGYYARKLLQPFPLNFGIIEIPTGYVWVGCLLILLVVALICRLSWAGCFILTAMSLGSVALLVALGNVSWTPYAERYMYAPSAMLAIGGSLTAGQAFRRFGREGMRPYVTCIISIILLIGFVGIVQRGVVWQDNLTLFADTVKKSPNFALANNQLAEALWNHGQHVEALEVVRHLNVADTQVAFINRVLILMDEGRLEEARSFLLENLGKKRTQGYHTVILERLIEVVERMRTQSASPKQLAAYDDEVIGYLQELWRRTHKPFYLYRLGQKHLARGDIAAARENFTLAYSKLPTDSIYREPARKLAENLMEK